MERRYIDGLATRRSVIQEASDSKVRASVRLPESLRSVVRDDEGLVPPQTLKHLYEAANARVELGTYTDEDFERIMHNFLHNSFGGLFRGSAET